MILKVVAMPLVAIPISLQIHPQFHKLKLTAQSTKLKNITITLRDNLIDNYKFLTSIKLLYPLIIQNEPI